MLPLNGTHAQQVGQAQDEDAEFSPQEIETLEKAGLAIAVPQELAERSPPPTYGELMRYRLGKHPLSSPEDLRSKLPFSSFNSEKNFSSTGFPELNYIGLENVFILDVGGCQGSPICGDIKIVGVKCHADIFILQNEPSVFPRVSVDHPEVQNGLHEIGAAHLGEGKIGWWFQFRSDPFRYVKDGEGGHPKHGCHLAKVSLSIANTPQTFANGLSTSVLYREWAVSSVFLNPPHGQAGFPFEGPLHTYSPLQVSPQISNVSQKTIEEDATVGEKSRKRVRCNLSVYVQNLELNSPQVSNFEYHYLAFDLNSLPVDATVDPALTKMEQISLAGVNGATHSVARIDMTTTPIPNWHYKMCNGAKFTLSEFGKRIDSVHFLSKSAYGDTF